jgi:hypothetical protein
MCKALRCLYEYDWEAEVCFMGCSSPLCKPWQVPCGWRCEISAFCALKRRLNLQCCSSSMQEGMERQLRLVLHGLQLGKLQSTFHAYGWTRTLSKGPFELKHQCLQWFLWQPRADGMPFHCNDLLHP